MAAKALTENQCNWLHSVFPPPNCCICNRDIEIQQLKDEIIKLKFILESLGTKTSDEKVFSIEVK